MSFLAAIRIWHTVLHSTLWCLFKAFSLETCLKGSFWSNSWTIYLLSDPWNEHLMFEKPKKTSCLVHLNNLIFTPPGIAKRHGIINRTAVEQPLDSFPSTIQYIISPLPTLGCAIRLSLCSFPTCLQGPSWKHFNTGVLLFWLDISLQIFSLQPRKFPLLIPATCSQPPRRFFTLVLINKYKKKNPCQASRLSQLKQVKGFNIPVMINDSCKGATILK